MKIAQVNYAYDDELVDPEALLDHYTTLTSWSDALAARGLDVSVAQRFRRDARIVRNGVAYVFVRDGDRGDPRSRVWPRRVHRAVAGMRPDIAHVNGLNVPVQTWLLRRVLRPETAIVVQDHGGVGTLFSRGADEAAEGSARAGWRSAAAAGARHSVRRAAMRAADAFFFTAVRDADPWRQAGFIASRQPVHPVLESSTTIRPVDRFTAREDTRLEGDPALLWVGRLNENKDPLTILDGYEAALSRLPGAMLTLIYGTGDLLPGVTRRLQASARLAGRVRLRGAVPHERMASFYSAADLFVLGSHHEGSGYALLEACACGLPPVVTDIPTFRSMTDEGSIGALWPPGEPSAFADALVEVAGRDGRALRRQVLGHFERALSWTAVARQAADAYAAVLTSVGAGRHV